MKSLTTLLVLILVCLVSAKTINVPEEQPTVQAGIDAAVDGDMVLVAEGTYVENINFKGKAITVASHYAVDLDSTHIVDTIIDGSGATNPDSASTVSFISGEDTTSVLNGFTITGGSGTLWEGPQEPIQLGGGIVCIESGAKIIHNIILANILNPAGRIAEGAAIGAERGDSQAVVIVEDNIIINNRSEATGKMAESAGVALYATGRIIRNVIKNNVLLSDTFGGPVAIGSGVTADYILIKDNIITDNESTVTNGDINAATVVVSATKTEICSNTISHNKIVSLFGTYGTGLYLVAADNAIVRNNIITHNSCNHAHSFSRGCFVYLGQNILIEHNTISDNDSTGGLYIHSASATVQYNIIQRNTNYGMAGIGGYKATVLIQNNVISHNNALDKGAGGGIGFIDAESALIQNNLIFKNHGRRGGGIGVWPSTPEMMAELYVSNENIHTNSIDIPNQILSSQYSSVPNLGTVVLMNNTVVDNSAYQDGGGLYSRDWMMYVVNNIIWGNTGNDHPQIWDKNNSAIMVYNSDVQDGWSGMAFDVMDKDPQLVGPLYHLSSGSPCIGMGLDELDVLSNTVMAPGIDFGDRVRPNPAGSHPDMGAWEHRLAKPTPSHILHVPADFTTIQGAINASIDGDTVLVAEGTYLENINFKGKAITVASHYIVDQDTSFISKTIIDGSQPANPDSASTVLFVSGEDTTSVLMGLTITGGGGTLWTNNNKKFQSGGGIFCLKSGGRIAKNIIRDNVIESENINVLGGGLAAEPEGAQRFLIVEDNIIKNNRIESQKAQAEAGGLGIYLNCRIVNNVIQNNSVVGYSQSVGGALAAGLCDEILVEGNQFIANQGRVTNSSSFVYANVALIDAEADILNNHFEQNSTRGGMGTVGTVFMAQDMTGANIVGNTFTNNTNSVNQFYSRACYFFRSTNVLIENNVIDNNNRVNGILVVETQATIRHNEITNNKGHYGVAIGAWASTALIDNNIVGNNQAQTSTGGIWLTKMNSALVRNNIIYGNRANSAAAGGVGVWRGNVLEMSGAALPEMPEIPHRLPSRYAASEISMKKTTTVIPDFKAVVLINNTIVDNFASNYGGGVYVENWEVHLINNIIWGNTAGKTGFEQIAHASGTLEVNHCCVQGGWQKGTNIIDADPRFVEGSFELSDSSLCIGAGLASIEINGVDVTCGGQDCFGNVRPNPAGSDPDIGAYENERGDPFTDVMEIANVLPKEFLLAQNYPNPFNPTTTIRYDLPQPGRVLLTIYNVSGQLVRTLVDKEQNAGSYEQMWDATDFRGRSVSSGIYFYRCQFFDSNGRKADRVERAMLLLK